MQLSKENFIQKAIEIHGNKYDYSKASYVKGNVKVEIICKEHGSFQQRPKDHIYQKSGCRKCSDRRTANINRTSINDFILKANSIHNDKYDYSKVNFNTLKEKIIIICKEHGEFKQTADSHLCNHGCPKCSKKGFDKEKPAWLYFIYMREYDLYKIGVTNLSIEQRLKNEKYELLYMKYYDYGFDAFIAEQLFIRKNIHLKYNGNKVMINGGNTELFDIKIGAPKDAEGKQLKPEGWEKFAPEPKLQAILDKVKK